MTKKDLFAHIYGIIRLFRNREQLRLALNYVIRDHTQSVKEMSDFMDRFEDVAYYHHFFSDILNVYEFLERNSALTEDFLYNFLNDRPVYPYRIISFNYNNYYFLQDIKEASTYRTSLRNIGFYKDDIMKNHSSVNPKEIDEAIVKYNLQEFFPKK